MAYGTNLVKVSPSHASPASASRSITSLLPSSKISVSRALNIAKNASSPSVISFLHSLSPPPENTHSFRQIRRGNGQACEGLANVSRVGCDGERSGRSLRLSDSLNATRSGDAAERRETDQNARNGRAFGETESAARKQIQPRERFRQTLANDVWIDHQATSAVAGPFRCGSPCSGLRLRCRRYSHTSNAQKFGQADEARVCRVEFAEIWDDQFHDSSWFSSCGVVI